MSKYIMRLDDAADRRDIKRWDSIEMLLDKYGIKPLIGVIPKCEDPEMCDYEIDIDFWKRVQNWIEKGYSIAMHGYQHVHMTGEGREGINPVNKRSEFAGEPLDVQCKKIQKGVRIFREHEIEPQIFFAPSHTFDLNTIEALKLNSNIRVISDTIANSPYSQYGMTFIPQQTGRTRKMPLSVITFCYHPNQMEEPDFQNLEKFLQQNYKHFIKIDECLSSARKKNGYDKALSYLYFKIRQYRRSR